jgi:uncharacterized protein YdcH (DUF465 family)
MDQRERDLLEKYAARDEELKTLRDEHALYEKQLEKLESKPYKTPAEEQQIKQLKKQKLDGKTKMVAMLDRYAKQQG